MEIRIRTGRGISSFWSRREVIVRGLAKGEEVVRGEPEVG